MDERLERCKVHRAMRLVDAMRSLERGAAEIALVVDDEDRLVGTLTDGDVRRALLGGAGLDAALEPFVQRRYTAVGPQARRAEVIDLMRARLIGQIPIVDDAGRLCGLHILQEIIGAIECPNWAVIMAGGRGVRLRPLTDDIPKPMIRIAGRPILERIVLHLIGYGIRRVFISINYLGHMIEEHFGDGSRLGCRIEYLREERPLGTGGSLSLLPAPPSEPILVMNGDLVTDVDVASLLAFHRSHGGAGTMGVRRYRHVVPFGCVDLEGDRITRLDEKPTLTRMVNAGIYVLSPSLVARVPQAEMGMPDLFEQCLTRGDAVRAFEIETDWIDVGQREQLKRAREGGSEP
jgi:dTDP-glucose pyrophosphorylase